MPFSQNEWEGGVVPRSDDTPDKSELLKITRPYWYTRATVRLKEDIFLFSNHVRANCRGMVREDLTEAEVSAYDKYDGKCVWKSDFNTRYPISIKEMFTI